MQIGPLRIQLPAGLPTFTSGRGRYVWPTEGREPALLLHNDFDLLWIVRGRASMRFRDGTIITADRDDFILLPPFTSGWLDQSKAPLEFYYCHFSFRPTLGPSASGEGAFHPDGSLPTAPVAFSAREAKRVRSLYEQVVSIDAAKPGGAWRVESRVVEMVTELASIEPNNQDGAPLFRPAHQHDHRVARLCRKIQLDPAHPWVVTELAESIGLSPGRLHTLFKAATGESIKSYIVGARLRRAMTLLRERPHGELPAIKEVAAACGFSSQHFFSRQFRDHFHVTPIAFRDGTPL